MRWMLAILAFCLSASAASAGFRCGTDLVKTGDWAVEVLERCGDPDYVASYPDALVSGYGVVRTVEHWYYNRGPRHFIRRLEFRDGLLQREQTLGYGFSTDAARSCGADTLRHGVSEYEIVARCGEPLSKRVTWNLAGSANALRPEPVEEWLYEFGRTEFRRVVTFRNGKVIQVTTDDKPR